MPTRSLKIILRNLLDNAIKFSTNGAIKLYSQNVDSDFCDLVIEDSGLGMDESTRQELLKLKKRKRRYCRDGIRIAIMQIYDQEKRRFRIERKVERDKMIVSLPKPQKKIM
jgi:light-regulated signal transduction histidine kinase (bacteriophytochrome)